jgi:hypothetical protein
VPGARIVLEVVGVRAIPPPSRLQAQLGKSGSETRAPMCELQQTPEPGCRLFGGTALKHFSQRTFHRCDIASQKWEAQR